MKTIRITRIIIDRVSDIEVDRATDHEEEVGFSERFVTITDANGEVYEIVLEATSKSNLAIVEKSTDSWLTPKVYKGADASEKAF